MNKYLSIALTLVLILSASQSALYAQNSAKPHRQKDEVLSPNKRDSKIPTSKQEPTLSAVTPVREDKIHLFSLEDVRITDGQFLQVQELDHE